VDKLRELMEEWRKQGGPSEFHEGPNCDPHLAMVYHECADELETLLSTAEATSGDAQGELEKLRELSEKATPGEWKTDDDDVYADAVPTVENGNRTYAVVTWRPDWGDKTQDWDSNAAYIVGLVNWHRSMLAARQPEKESR
jgi:hypothetical protein